MPFRLMFTVHMFLSPSYVGCCELVNIPRFIFISRMTFSLFYVVSELWDEIERHKPTMTDGIDNLIVVDNVPLVGEDRLPKLTDVIRRALLQKFGKVVSEHYALHEESGQTMTKGLVLSCVCLIIY
jgi:hypothetical protein